MSGSQVRAVRMLAPAVQYAPQAAPVGVSLLDLVIQETLDRPGRELMERVIRRTEAEMEARRFAARNPWRNAATGVRAAAKPLALAGATLPGYAAERLLNQLIQIGADAQFWEELIRRSVYAQAQALEPWNEADAMLFLQQAAQLAPGVEPATPSGWGQVVPELNNGWMFNAKAAPDLAIWAGPGGQVDPALRPQFINSPWTATVQADSPSGWYAAVQFAGLEAGVNMPLGPSVFYTFPAGPKPSETLTVGPRPSMLAVPGPNLGRQSAPGWRQAGKKVLRAWPHAWYGSYGGGGGSSEAEGLPDVWPGPRPRPRSQGAPPPPPPKPPRYGRRAPEKKLSMPLYKRWLVVKALENVTEACDAAGALFQALPNEVRAAARQRWVEGEFERGVRRPSRELPCQQKALAVLRHHRYLDAEGVVRELLWEGIQDALIGIQSQLRSNAVSRLTKRSNPDMRSLREDPQGDPVMDWLQERITGRADRRRRQDQDEINRQFAIDERIRRTRNNSAERARRRAYRESALGG